MKKNKLSKNYDKFFIVEMFYEPLVFVYLYILFCNFQKKYNSNIITIIFERENVSFKYLRHWFEKKFLDYLNINYLFISKKDLIEFKIKNKIKFENIFNELTTKEKILNFKYNGVPIGFSIYDEYLRLTNKPTISEILNNDDLKNIITKSIYLIETIKKFKISGSFIFHDTYLPYGPIKESLIMSDIPVFGTFAFQCFSFLRFKKNLYYIPWDKSKENFNRIPEKIRKAKIDFSKNSLEKLYTPSYQESNQGRNVKITKKKYSNAINTWSKIHKETNISLDKNKINIVVFLHAFSDAPHRFKNVSFSDYWEWSNFVLKNALQTNFEWFIKPHPLDDKPEIIKLLKNKFNGENLKFISSKTNNMFFIENNFSALFTCHGTCCYEFALYGMPVVTFGECQTQAFNFNIHCGEDKDLLREKIINADKLRVNVDKEEVYKAYYFNYLFFQDYLKKILPSSIISDYYNNKIDIFKYATKKFDYNLINENFNFWFNLDLEKKDIFKI